MRINRKFKGSKTKDAMGYLAENEANFTPFKEIPGGDITMEGVDMSVLAIPVDENGAPMGMTFMEPGKEYEFGGANKTYEIPVYKKGGKSAWVSNKIKVLKSEGRSQDQAVAMALSMWDKKMKRGGEMIKKADGSYSRRGLWDNIRANKGSGKKPTKEMLKQEPKIKAKEKQQGGRMAGNRYLQTTGDGAGAGYPDDRFLELYDQGGLIGGDIPGLVSGTNPEPKANPWGRIIHKEVESVSAPSKGSPQYFNYGGFVDGDIQSLVAGTLAEPANLNIGGEIDGTPTPGPVKPKKTLTREDIQNIQEATPVEFEEGFITEFFEPIEQGPRPEAVDLDLGRYKNVNYFDVVQQKGDSIVLTNTARNPHNASTIKNLQRYIQDRNPGVNVEVQYSAKKSGGKVVEPQVGKGKIGYGQIATEIPMDEEMFYRLGGYKMQMGGQMRPDLIDPTADEDEIFELGPQVEQDLAAQQAEADLLAQQFQEEVDQNYLDTVGEGEDENLPGPVEDTQDPFQFFNPYAGVDLEGAANIFGRSLGEGDTGMAIASGAKFGLGAARSFVSGLGAGRRNQFVIDEINEETRRGITESGVPRQVGEMGGEMQFFKSFEMGGDVDIAELMTGAYQTGGAADANVEVEKNEYILDPQGKLTKVLGKTHENGGEEMNLEEGTLIVSDHLKPTKAQAKELSEKFDVEVSTKDTYAKAIDKFYKKSGLADLIQEEAEVIEKLETLQKKNINTDSPDQDTMNVNMEFLSAKINDIEQQKAPLMQAAKVFFQSTYDLQEAAKNEKAVKKAPDQFKIGGQTYNTDQVIKMGRNAGLSEERTLELAQAMMGGKKSKKKGKMQDGGNIDPNNVVNEPWFKDMFNSLRAAGYKGTDDVLEMQTWMAENKPEAVLDYFKSGPATYTSKGLGQIAKQNPDVFKEAGVRIKQNPGNYTEEERTKIKSVFQSKGLESDEFLLDQFQDGLKAYRTPLLAAVTHPSAGITPVGDLTISMPEVQLPQVTKDKIEQGMALNEEEEKLAEELGFEDNGQGVYLLPDRSVLPPQGMIPPVKQEIQLGRMDAERFTPDAQLAELNRAFDAAQEELDKLPSGQRENAIIQMAANKQAAKDKIINQVETQNKQLDMQEEAFNIRQGDRESQMNLGFDLSFEQRAQGALANTEDDFRRFFNEVQSRNVEQFKEIENLNLMNALYENIDFTPTGVRKTVDTYMPTTEERVAQLRRDKAVQLGTAPQQKKGGKVRKRKKRRY